MMCMFCYFKNILKPYPPIRISKKKCFLHLALHFLTVMSDLVVKICISLIQKEVDRSRLLSD